MTRPPRLQLIRNATVVVELGSLRLLVDPMLDAQGARPPVEDSLPALRNPLVDLPCRPTRSCAPSTPC